MKAKFENFENCVKSENSLRARIDRRDNTITVLCDPEILAADRLRDAQRPQSTAAPLNKQQNADPKSAHDSASPHDGVHSDHYQPSVRLLELPKENDACGFLLTRSKWDPYPWVSAIEPDSPAEVCGLKAGDCLLEVNGVDVLGLRIADIAKLVKSKSQDVALLLWSSGCDTKCDPESICCGPMPGSLQRLAAVVQAVLNIIECPVCLNTIEPPAMQCQNGHLICVECRIRAVTCPVCRYRYTPNPSLTAEQLYAAITSAYPLTHDDNTNSRLRTKIFGPHAQAGVERIVAAREPDERQRKFTKMLPRRFRSKWRPAPSDEHTVGEKSESQPAAADCRRKRNFLKSFGALRKAYSMGQLATPSLSADPPVASSTGTIRVADSSSLSPLNDPATATAAALRAGTNQCDDTIKAPDRCSLSVAETVAVMAAPTTNNVARAEAMPAKHFSLSTNDLSENQQQIHRKSAQQQPQQQLAAPAAHVQWSGPCPCTRPSRGAGGDGPHPPPLPSTDAKSNSTPCVASTSSGAAALSSLTSASLSQQFLDKGCPRNSLNNSTDCIQNRLLTTTTTKTDVAVACSLTSKSPSPSPSPSPLHSTSTASTTLSSCSSGICTSLETSLCSGAPTTTLTPPPPPPPPPATTTTHIRNELLSSTAAEVVEGPQRPPPASIAFSRSKESAASRISASTGLCPSPVGTSSAPSPTTTANIHQLPAQSSAAPLPTPLPSSSPSPPPSLPPVITLQPASSSFASAPAPTTSSTSSSSSSSSPAPFAFIENSSNKTELGNLLDTKVIGRYRCPCNCGKRFNGSSQLQRHVKVIHQMPILSFGGASAQLAFPMRQPIDDAVLILEIDSDSNNQNISSSSSTSSSRSGSPSIGRSNGRSSSGSTESTESNDACQGEAIENDDARKMDAVDESVKNDDKAVSDSDNNTTSSTSTTTKECWIRIQKSRQGGTLVAALLLATADESVDYTMATRLLPLNTNEKPALAAVATNPSAPTEGSQMQGDENNNNNNSSSSNNYIVNDGLNSCSNRKTKDNRQVGVNDVPAVGEGGMVIGSHSGSIVHSMETSTWQDAFNQYYNNNNNNYNNNGNATNVNGSNTNGAVVAADVGVGMKDDNDLSIISDIFCEGYKDDRTAGDFLLTINVCGRRA